jgi:FkbM family methyltransferase
MITVACVRVGEAYPIEYVEKLSDMCRRNLPEGFPGRFVCLTDRPGDLAYLKHIETIDISPFSPAERFEGWWAKMLLFQPELFIEGERIWYFDLDTVITGPLEHIFNYPGAFAILRDVYRPQGLQSSVMSFIVSKLTASIWDEWAARRFPHLTGGDQAVLEHFFAPVVGWRDARLKARGWAPDLLQDMYPGEFRSYKQECVWSVPKETKVVFFHGVPRPHDVVTGWVPDVWKVGGGSSLELVTVGTVAQGQVLRNIRTALGKGYREVAQEPAHAKVALICGGGPSIASQVSLIANLQSAGADIFSLNNADLWLRDKGFRPDYHVMLDARPDLLHWVNVGGVKLYASMCDASVLYAGSVAGDLRIWHPFTDGAEEILTNRFQIGGGGTVGTRALALAWFLGYRTMCVFGLDSSIADGEHHAYKQPLNDGEPTFDCIVGGRKFTATAWMIKQVEEFKEIAGQLSAQGCTISVFGEHLLSVSIAAMSDQAIHFPEGDSEGVRSAMATLKDLSHYVGMCTQRRTAVQAGGNVGIWPMHLSKYFNHVHTFEPDPANYACLLRNVARIPNISSTRVALGDRETIAVLQVVQGNSGASYLESPGSGVGVPVITLDSLNLSDVDLLQLDVEGFELQALKGARETIRRCAPLIVLELKGLGERHGYSDADVIEYLSTLGYTQSGVAHRDVIFKRTGT